MEIYGAVYLSTELKEANIDQFQLWDLVPIAVSREIAKESYLVAFVRAQETALSNTVWHYSKIEHH